MIVEREGRGGFVLLLEPVGEPSGGLADLVDELAGVGVRRRSGLDIGRGRRLELAQGVGGQAGVVVIEGHDGFSFLGFRLGPRPAGRRRGDRGGS